MKSVSIVFSYKGEYVLQMLQSALISKPPTFNLFASFSCLTTTRAIYLSLNFVIRDHYFNINNLVALLVVINVPFIHYASGALGKMT